MPMRHYQFILTIFFIALLSATRCEAVSYISFDVSGGYPATLDRTPNTRIGMGGMGSVGMSYQLHHEAFLFSVGFDIAMMRQSLTLSNRSLSLSAVDDRDIPYTLALSVISRRDRSTTTDLRFPVLFGGMWQGWYVMAGAVPVLNIWGNTYQSAKYATEGIYDRYYEPLTDLPQHGFHDYEPVSSQGKIQFRFDVRLRGEVGYDFAVASPAHTTSSRQHLRVGLFAEVGLLDISPATHDQASLVATMQGTQLNLRMNHAYNTTLLQDSWVRQAIVGVNLRYMIRVRHQKRHKCKCDTQYMYFR